MTPAPGRRLSLSVPAKILLLGEWGVTRGYPALATALSPRLELDVQVQAPGWDFEFITEDPVSAERDRALWRADLDPPAFFARAARTLEAVDWHPSRTTEPSLGMRWRRHWRLDEGLGSSSAVVLSLLWADAGLRNATPARADYGKFWLRAREILRATQGGRGSGLDLAAQLWGGTVLQRGDSVETVALDLPRELWRVHTGVKMDTTRELAQRELPPEIARGLGESCENFLLARDWPRAMREHHEMLTRLGVVPEFVQSAQADWRRAGWVDEIKTTGAGGGDTLLLWTRPGAEEALGEDLDARGWWQSRTTPHAAGVRYEHSTPEDCGVQK